MSRRVLFAAILIAAVLLAACSPGAPLFVHRNGMGMMGGSVAGTGAPPTPEQVAEIAGRYIAAYGVPAGSEDTLEIAEIMVFDNHYYVQARERESGRYAFEFLIDRDTGAATAEPGPNMMWNRKYGHMGGFNGDADAVMVYSPSRAVQFAQAYLDSAMPGLEADEHADEFYGYYTIHTLRDGETVGMLSVNGYTGQVWPHTWHGQFEGMLGGDDH